MEIGSRNFQNVTASREADKVFNPEIKEFFTPPTTGTASGVAISSAPSTVGLPDVSSTNATVSSAAGTDTATVPASSFTFPPLTNDLNSAPPDTEYPSFTSFGDLVPPQTDEEPPLGEGSQQVTVQEAFDDMVVLKDGMVTSASMSYERFQGTDSHLQESQDGAADPQQCPTADTEKTITEVVVTQATIEEPMDFLPEVSADVGTDAPPSEMPAEPGADGTEESIDEEPEIATEEPEVQDVSITVETLEVQTPVGEQPRSEEVITEQDSIAGVEAAEPEAGLEELPVVGSDLLSEKPTEEHLPSEKPAEGEPPSEKPPEGDPSSEMPAKVEISSETLPKAEPPIELSEGEETQQESAMRAYEVTEEDIQAIKGQKVLKTFGKKDYLGDVVNYDPETKWFKVVYEDGDEEDLEVVEVKPLLVPPGTSPTLVKKKRPRTDEDAEEDLNKSSKRSKKSSKISGRQKSNVGGKQVSKKQKVRSAGAKKGGKSPANSKTKSPGSKSKSSQKSGTSRKQKRPTKQQKTQSESKSQEDLDSPLTKSPGKSSMRKGAAKSRTGTPSSGKGRSSKLTKHTEVAEDSNLSTPNSKKTGGKKRGTTSSVKGKGKSGLKSKSPGTAIKVEDTPKSSRVGTKRKIEVEEQPAQSSSKRLRKGGAEKGTVPGREIDRVGEATFIGKPVRKDFDGTLYDGVVESYDKKRKYFKVKYDDGDQEDLEWRELELILVSEGKSDVDPDAKPAKVSLLSTLMSQEKKTGRSSAKKRKST